MNEQFMNEMIANIRAGLNNELYQLKNRIIMNVRSCLISKGGPISLKELEDDYRTLLDEEIPYVRLEISPNTRLGYENLQSFLASIRFLITTESPDGQMLVEAKVLKRNPFQYKNEIIMNVKSCLISKPGPISLEELEDDYRTLLGEEIPYAKVGYKNLKSFIASVPSLITRESPNPNGQILVEAQPVRNVVPNRRVPRFRRVRL